MADIFTKVVWTSARRSGSAHTTAAAPGRRMRTSPWTFESPARCPCLHRNRSRRPRPRARLCERCAGRTRDLHAALHALLRYARRPADGARQPRGPRAHRCPGRCAAHRCRWRRLPRRGGAACATPRRATPRRSRTITTSRTGSTRWCWARPWPTPAPCSRPGRHAGGGAGQEVRPRLPQAGLQPGSGCSTSAPAGAAWSCTPPSTTASRPRRDAVTSSRPTGRSGRSPSAGLRTVPRCGSFDYRDVPRIRLRRRSSIGLTEHIGARNLPAVLQLPGRQAAARRPDAEPHDHAALDPRAAPRRRLHRPLRVPRRRAGGRRHDHLRHAGPRARVATKRTCASTTR